MTLDRATLEAALIGYEHELEEVDARIAELLEELARIGGGGDRPSPRKRRTMSAAAKKRIAAAQRARWAAWRKRQA